MEIATILNAHTNNSIVFDTIESIQTYVGNKILLVTDGSSKDFDNVSLPIHSIKGFYHNYERAPYRNVALGLWKAYENFPDANWFCYTEYDCLFTSSSFKNNLLIADKNDVWLLGNDSHRDKSIKLPMLETIIKEKINCYYYVLGCCVFFCKEFIERLMEINFFERLINISNHFSKGFFPDYTGYDLSEHLYPTLVTHFGGDIGSFARYDLFNKTWTGSFRKFPIRWQPEIDISEISLNNVSIIHPSKKFDSEIRTHFRNQRNGKI